MLLLAASNGVFIAKTSRATPPAIERSPARTGVPLAQTALPVRGAVSASLSDAPLTDGPFASASRAVVTSGVSLKTPGTAIVVRPSAWSRALVAWKAHRAVQGHRIIEVDAELGQRAIQATIVRLASEAAQRQKTDPRESGLGYVLLIGDGNLGPANAPVLPAWYRPSTAMVKLGGDKEVATDNPYADIKGEEIPDLAIGRIPADSAAAAEQFLARTIAYEQQRNFGLWRRDVRVVAGVGGFGALADSVIEMTTSRFLTDRVPSWADVAMTYASPNSPYCPDPWRFSDATVNQLNAGSMFWVYVGHGHVKHLDFLRIDRDLVGILDDTQIASVRARERSPIAVFLACYTGAFDATEDCLSEQLVMSADGPVAALAATRVTGPYGLAALASGMLDQCYVQRVESLGDVVLLAKQQMMQPSEQDAPEGNILPAASTPRDVQMQMITAIASALSPAGHDLLAERREHVWQMNLLGDPMLRLHHPGQMEIAATPRIAPGETISVNGHAPQAGRILVELTRPRDKTPRELFVAGSFSKDQAVRDKMQDSYALANNRTLLRETIEVEAAGPFACDLPTKLDLAPGRYLVRVFVESADTFATGATEVIVRAPRKS